MGKNSRDDNKIRTAEQTFTQSNKQQSILIIQTRSHNTIRFVVPLYNVQNVHTN